MTSSRQSVGTTDTLIHTAITSKQVLFRLVAGRYAGVGWYRSSVLISTLQLHDGNLADEIGSPQVGDEFHAIDPDGLAVVDVVLP